MCPERLCCEGGTCACCLRLLKHSTWQQQPFNLTNCPAEREGIPRHQILLRVAPYDLFIARCGWNRRRTSYSKNFGVNTCVEVHRDGPSHLHVLVKADRPFKVRHLFKGNRIIVADNFAVQKPNWSEFDSTCADWGVVRAQQAMGDGLAFTSCYATIISKSADAWSISSKPLFGLCTQPRVRGNLFRHLWFQAKHHQLTVGAPYNKALYCFRSQPWFHSRFTRSSPGQGTCHHVMWVRFIIYLSRPWPRVGLRQGQTTHVVLFFFCKTWAQCTWAGMVDTDMTVSSVSMWRNCPLNFSVNTIYMCTLKFEPGVE